MRITDLETPALLIDLDVMEHNLRRAADYARAHGLRLRPHTKTHKTPALALRQLDLGAAGLTVAKVGEAEVMLRTGTPDLLLAYPILGRSKVERLVEVARHARVTVALDNLVVARGLSEVASRTGVKLGVLSEMDAGLNRVGVTPGEELVQLVQGIDRLPGLTWEGVIFYPGQIHGIDEDSLKELRKLGGIVEGALAELRRAGFEARVVSGGSTPTLYQSHLVAGMNEIRPGTYIFNDKNTVDAGACGLEDCAATMLVTVVSTARPNQAIFDGGSKTFSSDRLGGGGEEAGYGTVLEDPQAVFAKMNEEHGYLDIRQATRKYAIGDRLRVLPNHICTAVNLQEKVYGIRGEQVEEVWVVEGRGKLR
jgi:D-serine deaminase-like pyridoxal phosphate-dependent protein